MNSIEHKATDTQLNWGVEGKRLRIDVPGSNSWKDVMTFLTSWKKKLPHGKVHKGAYKSAKAIFDVLKKDLVRKKVDYTSFTSVLLNGHSLGGAIAIILTYLFRTEWENIKNFECRVIGAPKAVDKKMKAFLESKGKFEYAIYGNDPIPLLFAGYVPVGKLDRRKPRKFPWIDLNLIGGDHNKY